MNEGEEFVGTEMLDAALRDRFYVINMDYLPVEVERKILVSKTGISEGDADLITKVINKLRNDAENPVAISIRHGLMIAELIAAGASIREAVTYSLQVSKDVLETLLLSLHVETKEMTLGKEEYAVFVPDSLNRDSK